MIENKMLKMNYWFQVNVFKQTVCHIVISKALNARTFKCNSLRRNVQRPIRDWKWRLGHCLCYVSSFVIVNITKNRIDRRNLFSVLNGIHGAPCHKNTSIRKCVRSVAKDDHHRRNGNDDNDSCLLFIII